MKPPGFMQEERSVVCFLRGVLKLCASLLDKCCQLSDYYFLIYFLMVMPGSDPDFRSDAFQQSLAQALSKDKVENSHEQL